jgi:hypothetical protein
LCGGQNEQICVISSRGNEHDFGHSCIWNKYSNKNIVFVLLVFLIKTYFECFLAISLLYVCVSVEESSFIRITVKTLLR